MRAFVAAVFLAAVNLAHAADLRTLGGDAQTGTAKAVIVGRTALLHTSQLMPTDDVGRIVGKEQAAEQCAALLQQLDALVRPIDPNGRIVKLNIYLTRHGARRRVESVLAQRFGEEPRPAVTYVVTELPAKDALVALDAVVAVSSQATSVKHLSGKAAILPAGVHVYISGQAEKGGSPAEAARATLAGLGKTLDWLGLTRAQVVQAKSFLKPMSAAPEVVREMTAFFGAGKAPPLSFVAWESSLPIEIELVVAGATPKEKPDDVIEYLTPPGMTLSPIYSRVARVHSESIIYLSGLEAKQASDGKGEVEDVFGQLRELLERTGSDFRHLAKATYYVSAEPASRELNAQRPRHYDARRPPAASKAFVVGVGREERTLTLDMIAAPRK